jgi:hypothetical protein
LVIRFIIEIPVARIERSPASAGCAQSGSALGRNTVPGFRFAESGLRSYAQHYFLTIDRHLEHARALAWIAFETAIVEAPVPMMPGAADDPRLGDDLAVAQ